MNSNNNFNNHGRFFHSSLLCQMLLTFFLICCISLNNQVAHSNNLESDTVMLMNTNGSDMLPHTKAGSYYNEFWVYHIFLENDLQLHITFSLANFGTFKSAVSGGKLFVSNFNGANYNVAREFSLDRLVIDEQQHKMRLHEGREIYFKGKLPESHHILFNTTKDGTSYLVDLDFHDIHPGYKSGDGITRVEDDDMGIFVHIPKASVEGTVAVNDDTLAVRGTAYMDHTYQTDLSSKIVDKGFRHITHTDEGFHTGYYLVPKNRSDDSVIGIALENKGLATTLKQPTGIQINQYSDIAGNDIPKEIEVAYLSGDRQVFRRLQDFQSVSFLEEVGGFRKRLVRRFLGGEIIEYVGTGDLNNGMPANYNFLIVH